MLDDSPLTYVSSVLLRHIFGRLDISRIKIKVRHDMKR